MHLRLIGLDTWVGEVQSTIEHLTVRITQYVENLQICSMYSYYSFICKKRSHPCKLTALVVTLLTLAFVLLQLKRKSILKSNCQKFHVAFKSFFLMQTFSLCSQPTAFLSTRSVWTPNSPPNPVLQSEKEKNDIVNNEMIIIL